MRILIAEDEVEIARALKVLLEKNKCAVDIVHNGKDAWDFVSQGHYDVIVLDIMMSEMDGLEVLRRARENHIATPVMLLTAKSEIEDRVAGLNAGADDYLPKPFAASEFIARVKALGRRSTSYTENLLCLGNTTLDCNRFELSAEGEGIRLNNKEFQLMELFFRYPNKIFSPEHLMETFWVMDSNADINVIWTYISFLRKKLKEINSQVQIRTIRGAGYSLEKA